MPMYMYRREDGTEFEYRQKFSDDPLTVDPETGQKVVRVIQPAGIVFKGSGFYVNDSKGSKSNLNGNGNGSHAESNGNGNGATESKSTDTTESKDTSSTSTETKETKPAKAETKASA